MTTKQATRSYINICILTRVDLPIIILTARVLYSHFCQNGNLNGVNKMKNKNINFIYYQHRRYKNGKEGSMLHGRLF